MTWPPSEGSRRAGPSVSSGTACAERRRISDRSVAGALRHAGSTDRARTGAARLVGSAGREGADHGSGGGVAAFHDGSGSGFGTPSDSRHGAALLLRRGWGRAGRTRLEHAGYSTCLTTWRGPLSLGHPLGSLIYGVEPTPPANRLMGAWLCLGDEGDDTTCQTHLARLADSFVPRSRSGRLTPSRSHNVITITRTAAEGNPLRPCAEGARRPAKRGRRRRPPLPRRLNGVPIRAAAFVPARQVRNDYVPRQRALGALDGCGPAPRGTDSRRPLLGIGVDEARVSGPSTGSPAL